MNISLHSKVAQDGRGTANLSDFDIEKRKLEFQLRDRLLLKTNICFQNFTAELRELILK